MTSRSHPQYTPTQVIERCACITLDDLAARNQPALIPLVVHLRSAMRSAAAYECGAHLLEWPDGNLVLVVSQAVRDYHRLSRSTILASYRWAVGGCGLVYRDTGGVSHVA